MTNTTFNTTKHLPMIRTSTSPAVKLRASRQRGATLLTITIMVGITAIFAYFAITFGLGYFGRTKVNNEIAIYTDLKANIVGHAANVGVFTAANSSLAALVGRNILPRSLNSGTAAAPVIANQWGGGVTVAVGTVINAGDALVFTSTAIPTDVCVDLGAGLDRVASVVSINGTVTKANGANTVAANVIAACAAGDNNTFVVTISR